MKIEKINIYNYKCYYSKFSIDFNKGVNILVGDNGSGKSTILEAAHLALSGILYGRYLKKRTNPIYIQQQGCCRIFRKS
ncbi:AAA family ATPase [Aeromonas bivalvium]|uniref:AAA family ATPase n=1 Tax=Aeromonas bivalvium TaxID=440079 RepID=A0ABW9GLU9_9GAMM